jgi:tetratricopeptide (TPR) repeat protein
VSHFLWPQLLVSLGLAWCLVFWRFAVAQRRAVAWIDEHVSTRFRGLLTAYDGGRGLRFHLGLIFVLGALLVVAAAGPGRPGEGEATVEGGRLLILLDSSASMAADDVTAAAAAAGEGADAVSRFEAARLLALNLVQRLDGHDFAVVSFSGAASYQLPFTGDRELVAETLRVAELHTSYRTSGSSFAAALDAALHFVDGTPEDADLQVLLLSDGEPPFDEAYDAPLGALAERGVPVHAAAFGTTDGQGRLIWDFRDVVAGVEPDDRRVLREFVTRRVDRHLRRMARRTGGRFVVAEPGCAALLEAAIRQADERRHRVSDPRAWLDRAAVPLALFVVLFLADRLLLDRPRRPPPVFDLDRLGPPAPRRPGATPAARRSTSLAILGLLAAGLAAAGGCGDSPLQRAHRENELGIAADALGRHDEARRHYERAIGFGERPWVPTFNLARSRTLAGDPSEAHDLFQRALELKPGFPEALYNDGVALYRWGEAERDPRGCELERTRELWRAAAGRFAAARGGTLESRRGGEGDGDEGGDVGGDESAIARAARANADHAERALAEIDRLIADPPPECRQESGGDGAGGGGDEDGTGGGAGAGDGGGADDAGASPPAGTRPPSTGGAEGGGNDGPQPLTADEQDEIRRAFERMAEQRGEEGKFFRRGAAEQFPRDWWENPDEEIWW